MGRSPTVSWEKGDLPIMMGFESLQPWEKSIQFEPHNKRFNQVYEQNMHLMNP